MAGHLRHARRAPPRRRAQPQRCRGQGAAALAQADAGEPHSCYAVLCYAVLCYAMLCYAVLCCAMLCHAMLCDGAGEPRPCAVPRAAQADEADKADEPFTEGPEVSDTPRNLSRSSPAWFTVAVEAMERGRGST
jgi:hypothetical protein